MFVRQESRAVYCRNVQLMPTLFLKPTKVWERQNSKFVDFNDPTQIWRRASKKLLRISTKIQMICIARNYSYWLTFLPLVGLRSLVFT